MKHSSSIAIALSLVLAAVAMPAAGACAMDAGSAGHPAAEADSDSTRCHDPVPPEDRQSGDECPDCLDHCPVHGQAALLTSARVKVADPAHPSLPPTGGLDAAGIANRLFRPPADVPSDHSFES